MKYELLKSYYWRDKTEYEKEYKSRINSPSTLKLGFSIHGKEAFVMMTPEIVMYLRVIYDTNSNLIRLSSALPKHALYMYQRNCLIDEIMLTNDIEGIYSTRKEITDILSDLDRNEDRKKRFNGLVKKYLMFINEEPLNEIISASQVRELYNELVLDEVDEEDKPDGALFRSGSVSVRSQTMSIIHEGIYPESKIISTMNEALNISNDPAIEPLIRAGIFHYLFGYIHPFYDGNGRTARFISSISLAKHLNPLVACRLSYAIKNNKQEYYKAFDMCNDKYNNGDLTPFVHMFLKIVSEAVEHLAMKLEEYVDQILHYRELINIDESETVKDILFILIQNALFCPDPIDREELRKVVKKTYSTVTKDLNHLIASGLPIKQSKSGRRIVYSIDLAEMEEYLQSL